MALKIKNLVIGEGRPKICVPITAKTEKELEQQLKNIKAVCFSGEEPCVDLLEWRMDFWELLEKEESRSAAIKKIKESFPELPLLCTFRSKEEGGEKEFTWEAYEALCRWVLEKEAVELLDVELFAKQEIAKRLLMEAAKKSQTKIILSNHDFEQTPSKEEIIERLRRMDALGADILKIAVMPQNEKDVLTLLEATQEMKRHTAKPVVTMSMGKLGLISRLSGEVFGSAITFGTAGRASAPGQIEAEKLLQILNLF